VYDVSATVTHEGEEDFDAKDGVRDTTTITLPM
jgi:hypothetical protein